MILVGNQRGNYIDAARHFMNSDDNEKVVVHQVRGFVGKDLYSAFQESYACSLGTKAKQHLYSLSLSPPKNACVSATEFERAIDRAEERLGLMGQPRAIVIHEKRGADGELRTHAHAVWCRIDAENGKAIHMSYDRSTLFDYSRELFLENGWELPNGYLSKQDRSPLNYTHAEHQQARRRGKYADQIKHAFQSAWQQSDTRETFASALREQGYILARGGHAAFVAVDRYGEVYSIARSLSIKTKEVRARLGEPDHLPSVEKAEVLAAKMPQIMHQFNDAGFTQSELPPIAKVDQTSPEAFESPIAQRLKVDPEHILSIITDKESSFSHRDIAKGLSAYLHDPEDYSKAYEKVLASDALVALNADASGHDKNLRYSTQEIIDLENQLISNSIAMSRKSSASPVSKDSVHKAIESANCDLMYEAGVELSDEQRSAIHHVTDDAQLSCVVGVAGAGKSTILNAARQVWEEQGYRVFGAALAGKAAKGLEQSSGIQSRTLASFEMSWQNDFNQLQRGDVLVIDEAGMVGSKQMAKFVSEANDKGAKLVLVGDAEQLQPINAGAPFRAITEQLPSETLQEVHRQKEDWQKQASKDLALGKTSDALNAYLDKGKIDSLETHEDAIVALASDYLNDFWQGEGDISQLALAHRKVDVKAINKAIRDGRKEAGELDDGITYKTEHGKREFAAGDRLLFTRNDRDVGVTNGMLGRVVKTEAHCLTIELDDQDDSGNVMRTISIGDYKDIEYGYATTIHKSQGATVDHSYVLASRTMDRHLTYVAMTRHKEDAQLYAGQDEFKSEANFHSSLGRKRQKQSTLDFKSTQGECSSKVKHQGQPKMVKETEQEKQVAAARTQQQVKDNEAKQSDEQQKQADVQQDKEAQKQAIMDRLKRDREAGPNRDR